MILSTVTDEVSPNRSEDSVPHVFEKAARAGVKQIEVRTVETRRFPVIDSFAWDKMKKASNDFGIDFAAVSPGMYKASLKSDLLRAHRGGILEASLDLGESLWVSELIIFGVQRHPDDSPEDVSQVIDILGETVDRAAERGFSVLMENIPGSWADTGENCLTLMEGVNRSSFGFIWDTGNLYESEEKHFLESYQLLKPYIRDVHIKDGEIVNGKMEWKHLGTGVTDVAGQIKQLKSDGYEGRVVLEAKCEPHEEEDFDVSVEYLKSFM